MVAGTEDAARLYFAEANSDFVIEYFAKTLSV
jgi:hypothetical protein